MKTHYTDFTTDFSESEMAMFLVQTATENKNKIVGLLLTFLPIPGLGRVYLGDIKLAILQFILLPICWISTPILSYLVSLAFGADTETAAAFGFLSIGFGSIVGLIATTVWKIADCFILPSRIDAHNAEIAAKISASIRRRRATLETRRTTTNSHSSTNESQQSSERAQGLGNYEQQAPTASERQTTIPAPRPSPLIKPTALTGYLKAQQKKNVKPQIIWGTAVLLLALLVVSLWRSYQTRGAAQLPVLSTALQEAPFTKAEALQALNANARTYLESIKNKNIEETLKYLAQEQIEALGGMDAAKQQYRKANSEFAVRKYAIGTLQVVDFGRNEYLAVADVRLEGRKAPVSGKSTTVRLDTGLIGYSEDGGRSWTFSGISKEEQRQARRKSRGAFEKLRLPTEIVFVLNGNTWTRQGAKS